MKSPAVSAMKRTGIASGAGFALGCGCKDAKSVSVSASPSSATAGTSKTTTRRRSGAGTTTTTTDTSLTSASSSSLWEDAVAELRYKNGDDGCRVQESTPSFSGLLRELSELEKSVASWGARKQVHVHRDGGEKRKKLSPPGPPPHEQYRKAKAGEFSCGTVARERKNDRLSDGGLEGSVAVVKQSDDPLGDFRRSMLQLIVENGIVAREDLREMLRRFLALNAPRHHDAILRAFAEIWDDVFVAATMTPSRGGPTVVSRRDPGRPPAVPRTPSPRHRRSPPAWRV